MKKINFLLFITIFHLSVLAQQPEELDFSKAFKAGMERRADIFKVLATHNKCIEFVGGSIAEDCEWRELFNDSNIINRGIDGNTTIDVLNRMDELVRHSPSKVFLEIGTSDLGNGIRIDTIINNISEIAQYFSSVKSDSKIYIFSILPPGPDTMPGMNLISNNDVLALNAQLKALCEEYDMTYLDLYSSFLDENKTGLNTRLGRNNLKLSVAGYALLKELITNYVHE